MVTWKPQDVRYGGGDSTFGADFAKGEPAIAKQLCNAAGAFEDKKSVTVGAYSYKVKIVPKKDGSGSYTFIERKQTYVGLGDEKPEVTAAKAVQQEYSNEGAKQGHLENVAMHKEMLAAVQYMTAELVKNTAACGIVASEVQGLKHLFEIMVNESGIVKNTFQSAAKLKTGGGNNTQ